MPKNNSGIQDYILNYETSLWEKSSDGMKTRQIFLKVKEVYNFLNFSNINCIPAELKLKHIYGGFFFPHQTFPIQKRSGFGQYLSQ